MPSISTIFHSRRKKHKRAPVIASSFATQDVDQNQSTGIVVHAAPIGATSSTSGTTLNAFHSSHISGKASSTSVTQNVDPNRSAGGGGVVHSAATPRNTGATSSTTKATLNAFKSSLNILGTAPLPGIGPITAALLKIINSLQEMSEVETGWQELAQRMERLSFLVCQIGELPQTKDTAEELCRPMKEQLNKLADAIDEAARLGKLPAFFNSTDNLSSVAAHGTKLDSIVGELTLAICMNTPLTKPDLDNAFQEAISRIQEEISKTGSSNGVSTQLMNTKFRNIYGSIGSGNKTWGTGTISQLVNSCEFDGVQGSMFSGNTVVST